MRATMWVSIFMFLLGGCGNNARARHEPGYLDETELTAADWKRLEEIGNGGTSSNQGIITSLMGGEHLTIMQRDFELLRQNVRRARAAYPDVTEEDLSEGRWIGIDVDAGIPVKLCRSHNANATRINGEWVLDGGCYISTIKPDFPKRATVEETHRFFQALDEQYRKERTASLKEHGPLAAMSGSSGSYSVTLHKETNEVVIEKAKEWAETGSRWTFPFVIDEWIETSALDWEAIQLLPSFAQAKKEIIKVPPSGLRIFTDFGSWQFERLE